MESAEMISAPRCSASRRAISDLPTAVGPARKMGVETGFTGLKIPDGFMLPRSVDGRHRPPACRFGRRARNRCETCAGFGFYGQQQRESFDEIRPDTPAP